MECTKTIGEYKFIVKIWHTESADSYIINSEEFYYQNGAPTKRELIPTTYLRRFDRVADDCMFDYCEKLENGD